MVVGYDVDGNFNVNGNIVDCVLIFVSVKGKKKLVWIIIDIEVGGVLDFDVF